MRRSTRNLSLRVNPGHLTITCARGVGNHGNLNRPVLKSSNARGVWRGWGRLARGMLTFHMIGALNNSISQNPARRTEEIMTHNSTLAIDCEQSLIFLCKVTARETQAREPR